VANKKRHEVWGGMIKQTSHDPINNKVPSLYNKMKVFFTVPKDFFKKYIGPCIK